ncbi:MAG: helix-turn-helix transcriptional regulator [Candidatus Tectomicrobia bacterium]|nr:helix-turn-helix transcriptional regulator [Candidatus Tectomicrobia bacterium]
MNSSDAFARIMATLQDAMLDDAQWPAASALIDEACGMKGNGLIVGEGFAEDAKVYFARFYFRGERRPDLEREYFTAYHPVDERLPRLRQLPHGRLAQVSELYTGQELKTSATYNDWLRRAGGQNSLNVRLDAPDGMRIVWATADPIETGAWGASQVEMLKRLLPHIRQFVQIRQELAGAQALGSSLSGLLDQTRIGVIHLDRRGRIIEANARALDLLRRADGLYDRDGYLNAWLPAHNERLQSLLSRALPPSGGPGIAGTVTVGRLSKQSRLVLYVSPVEGRGMDFGARRVAALLLVVEPDSQARLDKDLVAEAFGLTEAETEVAVMLSEGRTPRAIADLTDRRPNTVYNLIKLAYLKLGVSRQADLVRLLWQLSDISASRH